MPECINYEGFKDKDGYGLRKYKGKTRRAHRVAYCEANNLPLITIKGMVVRHTCDNPSCINPRHLLIGTVKDNSKDMLVRGRHLIDGRHFNAILTEEDVVYIRKVYKPRCKQFGAKALAERLGTTYKNISAIALNKTWRNV